MASENFKVSVGVKLEKTDVQAQLDKIKNLKIKVNADLDEQSFNTIKQKIESAKNVDVKVHAKFDQSSFKANVRDKIESAKNIDAKVGVRFDQSEFKTKVRERINNSKNISVKVGAKLEADDLAKVKAQIEKKTADVNVRAVIKDVDAKDNTLEMRRATVREISTTDGNVILTKAQVKEITTSDGSVVLPKAVVKEIMSSDGSIMLPKAIAKEVTSADNSIILPKAVVNSITSSDGSITLPKAFVKAITSQDGSITLTKAVAKEVISQDGNIETQKVTAKEVTTTDKNIEIPNATIRKVTGWKNAVKDITIDAKINAKGFGAKNSSFDSVTTSAKQASSAVIALDNKIDAVFSKFTQKRGFKFDDSSVTHVVSELGRMGIAVDKVVPKLKQLNNGKIVTQVTISGIDDFGRAFTSIKKLEQESPRAAASLSSVSTKFESAAQSAKEFEKRVELASRATNLSDKIELWLKDNSAAALQFERQLRDLQRQLKNCDAATLKKVASEFDNIKTKAKLAGVATQTMTDKLKTKFKEYATYFGASSAIFEIVQGLRYMAQAVLEVDTAMTGLMRVTELTNAQYDELYDKMVDSAKEYGRTLTDTINATADWVRAGFDENTALGLAEVTAMYQNVSDLDYDEAAENLLTSYNGFKQQLSEDYGGDTVAAVEHITDVLNELDNEFSVTSAGLGEGLARSASALQLAGNTFEESAAMIGAVTEVTQDPEKAGKMYARTYSNVWCNYNIA